MQHLMDLLTRRVSAESFSDGLITMADLETMAAAACLAPSAYHMQNRHFTAVCSPETKQKLYHAAFRQQKILRAAAVFIISGRLDGWQFIKENLQPSVDVGIISPAAAAAWSAAARAAFYTDPQARRDEAVRSASLAAMPLMLAAQALGWASCPMSGFDGPAAAKAAALPENHLPVLPVAVGRPHKAQRQKIRKPLNQVLSII